jgi:hypothetical protein
VQTEALIAQIQGFIEGEREADKIDRHDGGGATWCCRRCRPSAKAPEFPYPYPSRGRPSGPRHAAPKP